MAVWPYTTARWQRLRRLKLQINPCCELCLQQGWVEAAKVVDHCVPINAGGDPFPALDGLMSMCVGCHNGKTRAEQMGKDYRVKGCDVFGQPLDPNHPWNREAKKCSR